MSVFRFGLVGPKFQPKELSKKRIFFLFWMKGKMVKIPLLVKRKKDLKEETLFEENLFFVWL